VERLLGWVRSVRDQGGVGCLQNAHYGYSFVRLLYTV